MTDNEVKAVAEVLFPIFCEAVTGRAPKVTYRTALPEDREFTEELARAAISKLDEMRGDGWQPIKTAPKDGTAILLAGGAHDEADSMRDCGLFGSPVVACWQPQRPTSYSSATGYWLYGLAEAGYRSVEYKNPTHWMPLPPPPKQS